MKRIVNRGLMTQADAGRLPERMFFEIRHQIFAYATIYKAVVHYVLYTYYDQTEEFHRLQHHMAPTKISIPSNRLAVLNNALMHNGQGVIPFHL